MTIVYLNGNKTTVTEAREHLTFLSELGWRFKRIPGFEGQELYQAYKDDNPTISYPVEIKGIKPSKIFSKLKLLA